jgi:hypothetical protein
VLYTIFRPASRAPGSVPGQNLWVLKFCSLVLGQYPYQYTEFHTSTIPGSALHHISPGIRGPCIRPWTEFLGFKIFFFSFRTITINIPNFTLLRYRELLYTIFRPASGAPGSPSPSPDILGFKIFFFSFRTITINIPNFTLLRYREVLYTIFRPASGAPGSPLADFFGFQNFLL